MSNSDFAEFMEAGHWLHSETAGVGVAEQVSSRGPSHDDRQLLPHRLAEREIRSLRRLRAGTYAVAQGPGYGELENPSRVAAGSWLVQALSELHRLIDLEENWDGYGAPPIHPGAIINALLFLNATTTPSAPRAAVVATGLGNVQLEWHRDGIQIDVEIGPDGRYEASYSGPMGEREWSGNIHGGVEHDLARAIASAGRPAGA